MTAKFGGIVFFQLPVRDSALGTDGDKPLVAQPSSGPGVQGVADDEFLVAMGGESGLVAHDLNGANAVELPLAGGPEFDLIDEIEKRCPFSVKSLFYRCCLLFCHWCILTWRIGCTPSFWVGGEESGSRTRLHGFRVRVIPSDPLSA